MRHLTMMALGAFVAFGAGAVAQTADTVNNETVEVQAQMPAPAFEDNDADGICDTFQAGTAGQGRAGRPGRGRISANGTTTGAGPGFVDNDADGTCDTFQAGTPGRGYGARNGNRAGRGPRR